MCYCAKTVFDLLFDSGEEKFVLMANLENLNERINYLAFLREELERKIS
jgi:hypothetical protein